MAQYDDMEMHLLATTSGPGTAGSGASQTESEEPSQRNAAQNSPNPPVPNTQSVHSNSTTFSKLLSLWIATTIWVALIAMTVVVYKTKGNVTAAQKDTYNLLMTALILILGLSFFEAFKELARALSRRLVSRHKLNEEAKKLILGFDSLLKVAWLIGNTSDRWLQVFCIVWLLINIVAQGAVALISLTYSMDDGTNYNGTYIRNGKVQISNLNCYFHKNDCASNVTTHALAHAFGEMTRASECGNYNEITNSEHDYPYYCQRNDPQKFAHRFNEYNPNDTQKAYPFFTNRIITAASGHCFEHRQVGNPTPDTVGDSNALKYTYTNGSNTGSISIPTSDLGREGTTYIYRALKIPALAGNYECGPRCIWMWAYKNPGATDGPMFYECPITVSGVSNVSHPAHHVSNAVARTAAASIALHGQFEGTVQSPIFIQYQFYARGSDWEVHYMNASHVGANIAEFAMGSLYEMVSKNPRIQIDGTVPFLGSQLSVRWEYFSGLLAFIVAAHLAVFTSTFLAAKHVDRGQRR